MIPKMTTNGEVLILDGAVVTGDVTLGTDVSVWFNAVVRGDTGGIRVGARSNIQDCAVLHTDFAHPIEMGEDVTVGHGAVVHGCTVGDRVLIGMGTVILSGAVIGSDCLIGAGSLITGKTVVPDGSLVMGSPARVVRPLTGAEHDMILSDIRNYLALSRKYRCMEDDHE